MQVEHKCCGRRMGAARRGHQDKEMWRWLLAMRRAPSPMHALQTTTRYTLICLQEVSTQNGSEIALETTVFLRCWRIWTSQPFGRTRRMLLTSSTISFFMDPSSCSISASCAISPPYSCTETRHPSHILSRTSGD